MGLDGNKIYLGGQFPSNKLLALRRVRCVFCALRQQIIARQVNGSGINQRAGEFFVSSGGRAAIFGNWGGGKIGALFTSPVRWFCAFSSGPALFPVGQFVAFNGCRIFGGLLARWFMYSPISVANKAIKLTAFPSLFLWLNATLPQKNQLQSRNLWRRYAIGDSK